jgi:hypothetical protein
VEWIKGLRKLFLIIFLSVMLTCSADAVNIGVSPGVINFPGMIKSGYAEKEVLISTSSPAMINGHFQVEGEIKDWIRISPDGKAFNISADSPYRFKVIIQPPQDAKNGNYTAILRMQTDSLAAITSGAGSSVIAAVALKINIEVTGQESIACNAGGISISSTEIGMPFTVMATVSNNGNVRLRPEILVDVKNQDQSKTVYSTSFFGLEILPTTSGRIVQSLNNPLPVGQYFVELTFRECDRTQILTFDVFEKGMVADSGEFVGIRTNNYAYINEQNPIVAVFRNTGARTVVAKFKGQIDYLTDGKILMPLESDELSINPGELMEFRMFFSPQKEGKYQVSGRIIYNSKITFEEKSTVIEAVKGQPQPLRMDMALLFILYLVIGLAILILLAKIRKERKKKRRF